MYDITKTRMLLTTAVFAAVAALSASGANARIPDENGSGFEGHLSIVGVVGAQAPSWRGKGGKGEETRGVRGQSSGQLSSGFNGVADTGVADDRFDVGVNFQYWGV